jgi:hypothetical protein
VPLLEERWVHFVWFVFMDVRRLLIASWLGIMVEVRRCLWHVDLTALNISLGFGRGMDWLIDIRVYVRVSM